MFLYFVWIVLFCCKKGSSIGFWSPFANDTGPPRSGYTYDDLICLPGHIDFGVHASWWPPDLGLAKTRKTWNKSQSHWFVVDLESHWKWKSLYMDSGKLSLKSYNFVFLWENNQRTACISAKPRTCAFPRASRRRSPWELPLCRALWTQWLVMAKWRCGEVTNSTGTSSS